MQSSPDLDHANQARVNAEAREAEMANLYSDRVEERDRALDLLRRVAESGVELDEELARAIESVLP